MKSYSQALKILKKSKILFTDDYVKTSKCLNRVCAMDIFSKTNLPAANNSAFDGYAINSIDTQKLNSKNGKLFKVIGSIAAGSKPKNYKIKKFETFEIMTGGLIPKGCDAIVPKEKVVFHLLKKKTRFITIKEKILKNKNVRFKGSDFKKNQLLIKY